MNSEHFFLPFVVAAAAAACNPGVATATTIGTAAAPAVAPQAAPTLPSSLREALAIALDERPELRAAGLQGQAAQERVRQAASRFYPSLDLLMTAQRNKIYDTYSGITATATIAGQATTVEVARDSPRYTVTPTLQLGYDLYTGGRDSASVRNAQASQRSAALRAEVVSRDILREVTVNYLRLGQACQRWRMARRWADAASAHERATAERLDLGRASELEARNDSLARAQRELEVRTRAQDLTARYAEFVAALGRRQDSPNMRPEDVEPVLAGFDHEIAVLDERGLSGGQASIAGNTDQAETERARAEVQAAREKVEAERAANRPQVSLFGQYVGAGRSDNTIGSALRDERKGSYAVGVNLSVNLFSGYATQARVSEAELDATRLAEEANDTETRLVLARRTLEGALAQAQAQAQYVRQRREVAALQLQVTEAKAASGRALTDDVAQSRMALEAVDADIADSRIEVLIARVKLQFVSSRDAAL